jgi:signal transduction histidine kinase
MTTAPTPHLRTLKLADTAAADHAAPGESVSARDMQDLMHAFTETAQRLQQTHIALQDQVARLQRELAEANAALRRSQALTALGEMAAGIAHEVRNPLASIQLYVQMLAEDLADKPAQSDICGKIGRAVVGLDAIVRDVLAFARDTSIDPHPVSAHELIERAVSNCHSLLVKDIHLLREGDASVLSLHADAGLITQALSNVMRNAVEAMIESRSSRRHLCLSAARKRIRCAGGKLAERIIIGVRDSGPGIPPDVLSRVFNPFFTTRKTGTGLGLAIVHRIIDAHGGHINIQNVPTGGTLVELCLPPKPAIPRDLTPRMHATLPTGEGSSRTSKDTFPALPTDIGD